MSFITMELSVKVYERLRRRFFPEENKETDLYIKISISLDF